MCLLILHLHWAGTLAPPPRWVMWQGTWNSVKVMRPHSNTSCAPHTQTVSLTTPPRGPALFPLDQRACVTGPKNRGVTLPICAVIKLEWAVMILSLHAHSSFYNITFPAGASGRMLRSSRHFWSVLNRSWCVNNRRGTVANRVSLLSRCFMSPVTWPTEGVGPGFLLSASGIAA